MRPTRSALPNSHSSNGADRGRINKCVMQLHPQIVHTHTRACRQQCNACECSTKGVFNYWIDLPLRCNVLYAQIVVCTCDRTRGCVSGLWLAMWAATSICCCRSDIIPDVSVYVAFFAWCCPVWFTSQEHSFCFFTTCTLIVVMGDTLFTNRKFLKSRTPCCVIFRDNI